MQPQHCSMGLQLHDHYHHFGLSLECIHHGKNWQGITCRHTSQQGQRESSIPGPEDVPILDASPGPLAQGLAAAASGSPLSHVVLLPSSVTIWLAA